MRIKLFFAFVLVSFFGWAFSKTDAQIPDDITALAAMHSQDYYYQSNVPFSMRVAENLEANVNQIRSSDELDLEDKAAEIGAARKMLIQLDAARFAIGSGIPIRDAVMDLEPIWENQPEAAEDFSVERFRSEFAKARQNYNLDRINEMSEEPMELIEDAWAEFALPFLKKMNADKLENPIRFQFGLVQDVGYGLLTNKSEKTLKHAIVVINYEANGEDDSLSGNLVYYFPELEPEKSVAILSMPRFDWPSIVSEDNQRKFNAPLNDGSIKLTLDVYSENGVCTGMESEVHDGLRTQMDCLRAILVNGSVFASGNGDRMTIKKVTGSGRTLKVFFEEAGKTSINNAWKTEDRDDVFEPRSTAFRFRVSVDDDSDDNGQEKDTSPLTRGNNGKDVETGVPYTWRDGSLIKEAAFGRGGVILYPVLNR